MLLWEALPIACCCGSGRTAWTPREGQSFVGALAQAVGRVLRGEQAVCLAVLLHKGHTEVDAVEGLLVNAPVGKTFFPSSSSVLAR